MIRHYRSAPPVSFASESIYGLKSIVNDFYKRETSERRQDNFRFPELPSECKVSLQEEFEQKCVYCESKLGSFSPSAADNFRPQRGARGLNRDFYDDHYWWLAYEWDNLNLACSECSFQKGTWFPITGIRAQPHTFGIDLLKENPSIIDPCYDEPQEHLYFNDDGKVLACSKRGEITIEILKLNRENLVKARKGALKLYRADFDLLRTASLIYKHAPNKSVVEQVPQERCLAVFKTNCGLEFAGLKRYFFFKWSAEDVNIGRYVIRFLRDNKGLKTQLEFPLDNARSFRKYTASISKPTETIDSENSALFSQLDSVERIQIKNFKGIKRIDLLFKSHQNERAGWLLFLGENGLGKSSILQAIALALAGNEYCKRWNISPTSFLNHYSESGYVKIKLVGKRDVVSLRFDAHSFRYSETNFGNYLLAYGSTRLMQQGKLQPEIAEGQARIQNLFDPTIALNDATGWLHQLPPERFEYMARSLKKALLLRNEDVIEQSATANEILITHNGSISTLDKMSDGYKSVIALVVDIMQILERDGATMEEAQGVVLVDELETHLHPRWKMRIVEQLRDIFPRVQFIVTSHDPLCLRGLKQDETIVLKRDEDTKEILYLNDLPSPEGFRVDQLLTSEFFGLFSTNDPATEVLFDQYYKLLAKEKLTEEENNTLKILTLKLKELKHFGNTLREDMMYRVIDALLAKAYDSERIIDRSNLSDAIIENVKRIWEDAGII